MDANSDKLDPLIHIEFGKSRSKYFQDALSKAKRKTKLDNETKFVGSESGDDELYHFYTSAPESAREIWEIVAGWKSSRMEVDGEDIISHRSAGEDDLREIERQQRREELIERIDTGESGSLIEIRFGPSSSKYADRAVQQARHLDDVNDDTGYLKVTKGIYDNKKAEHLLVTGSASAAVEVYDTVENWKNSEIRIDGQPASKGQLKTLARNEIPFWVWVLIAFLLALSFLLGGS